MSDGINNYITTNKNIIIIVGLVILGAIVYTMSDNQKASTPTNTNNIQTPTIKPVAVNSKSQYEQNKTKLVADIRDF